ncbi:MAG: chalcone isomerase family protein [Acidobacteria bacterium]|nr:chalcone isomerase family protein [Acidobacteriota bacterium]
MLKWRVFLGVFLVALTAAWLWGAEVREESTGIKFPELRRVTHDGTDVEMTCLGVGVRKKFIVKVYGLAFYVEPQYRTELKRQWQPKYPEVKKLQNQEKFFRQLVTGTYGRRFEMRFVRDVDAETIRDSFRDSLEANMPDLNRNTALQKASQEFLAWFQQQVKENEALIINIFADGTLEAFHNSTKLGTMTHPQLIQGITAIWLGEECISDDLKEDLVRFIYK